MWREKKSTAVGPGQYMPVTLPPDKPIEEKPMADSSKSSSLSSLMPSDSGRTLLGRTLVFKGDLSGNEDLVIAGQFEGTLNVQGHCVTVRPEGKVKADIQATRVVIHGSVHGNISVRERLEIHKTGHVVGDLLAPGISIEDGAYFKGKIEIIRDGEQETSKSYIPLHVTAETTA